MNEIWNDVIQYTINMVFTILRNLICNFFY